MTRTQGALALIVVAGLAGCSGTPPRNAALEDARSAVNRAEGDSRVAQQAPVELQNARTLLARADAIWAKERKEEPTAQLAYLAGQQAAIAEMRARQRAAEAQITEANAERDRVRLDARTREAEVARSGMEQAKQQAVTAERNAQMARQQAEADAQHTAHLQQQLAELSAKPSPRGMVVTLHDVVFDFNKADLKPGAERFVDRLAAVLQENPDRRLRIEGFTDSQGSEDYNHALSERRALAVREALVTKGISANRIEVQGYGEAFPVASNDDAAGRQLNRRVEVVISDAQGQLRGR